MITATRFLLLPFLFILCTSNTFSAPVADPGSRGVDWDAVKEKVNRYAWAKDRVKQMQDDVRKTLAQFEHPPLGETGWFHEYFCDDDAQQLRFDPNKPHEHKCPACGRVYSGPPYDDCWRSKVHSAFVSAAADAGILYRISGDPKWSKITKDILLWYADNLQQFEPHGKHAGQGWIREQSLDEATQLVRLAEAYWDIGPSLTAEERITIAEQFLLPDARFIHKQTRTIHNIHSWHNAAVGLVGFAVGDKELIREAIDGPYGLKNQIRKGIQEDGFWFEGSISYHYYTVSSLQPLYLAARGQHYPLEHTEKFKRMYTAPIEFTFDNGEFPATNDGWPGQSLTSKESYYEIAASLWDDDLILHTLASMVQKKKRRSVNALLYGPSEIPLIEKRPRKSVLFKASGISILRQDPVNVYLKFGPYGGGHDHLDRLNMIFYANGRVVMPDLGTSGYGISLNRWYRSSAAHNLLVVDGKRQARCGGYLLDWKEQSVQAGVKDAYKGVDIQRTQTLIANGCYDHVQVRSGEKHQYDLFYHVRGTLQDGSIAWKPADTLPSSNGYDYLRNIQKGTCTGKSTLTWSLRDGKETLTLQCNAKHPYEVYVGECPDLPANQKLSFVMLRISSKNADWKNRITVKSNPR